MIITELDSSGAAAQKGLAPGDVILDIAGKPVNSNTEVHNALSDAEQSGRKDVLMRVRTANKETRFVAVPIPPKHETLWGEIHNWLHSL